MLDECKGDKFEDLLAAFSMVVLRKVLFDGGKKGLSACNSTRPEHVVPLIIAHHVSLQDKLQKRANLIADAHTHMKSLATRRSDLAARVQAISQPEARDSEAVSKIDDQEFRKKVVHAFAADPQWARFLFEGNVDQTAASRALSDDTPFKCPSEDPADDILSTEQCSQTLHADHPMSQLKELISQHQDHTGHLEALQMSLPGNDTAAPIVIQSKELKDDHALQSPEKAVLELRFSRHKMLNLTYIPG